MTLCAGPFPNSYATLLIVMDVESGVPQAILTKIVLVEFEVWLEKFEPCGVSKSWMRGLWFDCEIL